MNEALKYRESNGSFFMVYISSTNATVRHADSLFTVKYVSLLFFPLKLLVEAVLGLRGEVLAARGQLEWLLSEDTRSCPYTSPCQFQLAPKQLCHWPKLSPSVMLIVPV